MCTVTYIPKNQGFILTSNRDEQTVRPTIPPKQYQQNGLDIIYPKDVVAGGTWIAANTKKRFACLLNGAYERHIRKEKYGKSRGVVLLESFCFPSPEAFIAASDFTEVEPFTLLLIDAENQLLFSEIRWDGQQIYHHIIDTNKPHIWSSATLYNLAIRQKREEWFAKFLTENNAIESHHLLAFHQRKQSSQKDETILMNTNFGLQTVSISQLIVQDNKTQFNYFDLIQNQEYTLSI